MSLDGNEPPSAAHLFFEASLLGERLLTAREVADALGATPRWVLDHWAAGELPGFRLTGRMVRFRASEIEAWLESRHRGPQVA